MAEGGCDVIDPSLIPSTVGEPPDPKLAASSEVELLCDGITAVKLNGGEKSGEILMKGSSNETESVVTELEEQITAGNAGRSVVEKDTDSPSERDGKDTSTDNEFVKVGEGKKKRNRKRPRRRSSAKKYRENICVTVGEEEMETSFTILPKSHVKELTEGKSSGKGSAKSSDVGNVKKKKSKEKLLSKVISDVASTSGENGVNVALLGAKNGCGKMQNESPASSTRNAKGTLDDADESDKPTSSSKRRARRKKSKNIAIESLMNLKGKDFDEDGDEIPEVIKQFLKENDKKSKPSKKSVKSAQRAARFRQDQERRNSADVTQQREGCYTKLLRQQNPRERHNSLPSHLPEPRGFSPGMSPQSYGNRGPGRNSFSGRSQSPRQNLFPEHTVNDGSKRDGKDKKKEKKGKQEWRDQGRCNTFTGGNDVQSPRGELNHTRPRSQSGSFTPGRNAPTTKGGMMTPGSGKQTPKHTPGQNTPRSASAKKTRIQFEPYWSRELISNGLKSGLLVQGSIRINPKSYEDAYVSHPDRGSDIYVKGLADRNRALNGDIVVVLPVADKEEQAEDPTKKQVKSPDSSLKRGTLRRGKVVGIIEEHHSRACTGHIKPMRDKNPNYVLFSPLDHRLPRIMVPMADSPQGFKERPDDFANTLFVARITAWEETSQFAKGNVHRSLGEAGEIEPQTEGILNDYGVDYSEFSPSVLSSLPQNLPWTIPDSELQSRRDLRKEIIFTIDPASARDLDDALSCVDNGDGTYEIGVHIADVSYFVQEKTELDTVAASRATSVYLIQKVVPMLPRLLCEQLCSLNPDEDRLTFSVMWKMTGEGEILDIWFGRSVIRSCVKLSYDHAQGFLDEPDREWTVDQLPPISKGVSIDDIRQRVLTLNRIAKNMRSQRADNGALRLDQVKLTFVLDKSSGLPCGCAVYQQKDSNRLIEEFMLLANMSVANKIRRAFPKKAMLRCHPPPNTKMIDDLTEMCANMGIPLDASSSRALQESLANFYGGDCDTISQLQILTVMCSKPMQLAKYFCTGTITDEDDCWHYALSVPEYTHFTSPIRRYPDVIVHRQLAAALNLTPLPKASTDLIQKIADHCNLKKSNAKKVQEMSGDLFFATFVKESGPVEESGMVMAVLDKAFDVLILKFGVTKRVYTNKLNLTDFQYERKDKIPELTLQWKDGPEQKITMFTKVDCVLEPAKEPLKWNAIIKPPAEAAFSAKVNSHMHPSESVEQTLRQVCPEDTGPRTEEDVGVTVTDNAIRELHVKQEVESVKEAAVAADLADSDSSDDTCTSEDSESDVVVEEETVEVNFEVES